MSEKPIFTEQHYQALALAVSAMGECPGCGTDNAVVDLKRILLRNFLEHFADVLSTDNNNFDKEKFLNECITGIHVPTPNWLISLLLELQGQS